MESSQPLPKQAWPVSASTAHPPADEILTRLQRGKLLWVGEPGGAPEVEWLEDELDTNLIKAVLEPHLELLGLSMQQLQVEYLAQGTWNRIFLVTESQKNLEFIFRASLPVYPWYKTEAEVATLQFIHTHTTIPAPLIYIFDSSASNALGYEWIFMQKLPGVQYTSVVDDLSTGQKLAIARTIATWTDQLSRHTFDLIGSFYMDKNTGTLKLGRPVIQQFMGDWRHDYPFERGPFHNSYEYLRSFIDCIGAELFDPRQRLRAVIDAMDSRIRTLEKSSENEDAASQLPSLRARYSALMDSEETTLNSSVEFECFRYRLLDTCGRYRNGFTSKVRDLARLGDLIDGLIAEPFDRRSTVLYHWDISENNVLIDLSSGSITGLVDWEQLYTMPTTLLRSRYPPILARDGNFPDLDEPPAAQAPDAEKSNDTYFWEKQIMREEFDRKLRELESPWLQVGKDSKEEVESGRADHELEDIADLCSNCFQIHCIDKNNLPMEIYELTQASSYCEKILEKLEDIQRKQQPADQPLYNFTWIH
jgi:hypothetical protein